MMSIPGWLRRRSHSSASEPLIADVDARRAAAVQAGNGNIQLNVPSLVAPAEPWPIALGKPDLLAVAFQERLDITKKMDVALRPLGSTTILTEVLSGNGGIGKTQMAVKAYQRARNSTAYDFCLWTKATSRDRIISSYAAAIHRIDPTEKSDDLAESANRFLEWLQTTRNTWFIVLDDVTDPADVEDLWPNGLSGRTLVTTRRQDASLEGQGRIVINLDVFKAKEARNYLVSRLHGRLDALEGSEELADSLGYLPLALSQAAELILDHGITCEEYRRRFADRAATLDELFPVTSDQRQRTIATTWSLAIETADSLQPQGFSSPLLCLIAVLDPNGIPEIVLTSSTAQKFVIARLTKGAETPLQEATASHRRNSIGRQRAALRALRRVSLIAHEPDDPIHSVRMHALAQRATREASGEQMLIYAYTAAANALMETWPDIERDEALSAALRQNAATLTDLAAGALWTPHAHPILFRAGRSMEQAGLAQVASDYWREMLSASDRILGSGHPDTLTIRRELAYCQGQCGDPAGAVTSLERLLPEVLEIMGPKHGETLAVRRNLAWWRGETRDPAGAVAAYEELVADILKALGPDHPDTLTARYSLGRWRGQAGQAKLAVKDFELLLQDCLRVVQDPDALLTLAVRHDLAWWIGEADNAATAVAAYEALLPDRVRILGPKHLHTLATRHDLAWWRWHAKDRDRAKAELDSLCADYVKVMGSAHPHTRATFADFDFLLTGGQYGETHGLVRDTPGRLPGDLPGLDFLEPRVSLLPPIRVSSKGINTRNKLIRRLGRHVGQAQTISW